jgi:hypothetical protein
MKTDGALGTDSGPLGAGGRAFKSPRPDQPSHIVSSLWILSYNFDDTSLRLANHAVAFALIPRDFLNHIIGERTCNWGRGVETVAA